MSISAIEIKGGYYKEKKQFKIFTNSHQVASIIYGKNGSGKSSIARAFNEVFNTMEVTEFPEINFLKLQQHPKQGLDPLAIESINTPCFVHNEEFTLDKVSFNENGLETIVMFGEQIEITSKIDDLTNSLTSLKEEHSFLETNYIALNSLTHTESHLYIKEEIRNKLKNTWANRHQIITGNKTAGRVDENLINTIIDANSFTNTLEEVNLTFNNMLNKYQTLKSSNVINKLPVVNLPQNINTLINLLQTELEEPILTNKEKEILQILNSLNDNDTKNTLEFLNSEKSTCHTCLQDVSPQHKLSVLNGIQKILNTEEANTLKNTLIDLNILPLIINYTYLEEIIDSDLKNELSSKLDFFNNEIKNINESKKNKINNPYKSIKLHFNIKHAFDELNNIINKVNAQIEIFNDEIKQKNTLLEELKVLNLKIASIETQDLVKIYKGKLKNFNQLKIDLDNKASAINNVDSLIKNEQAALSNIHIALELINSYLQYIFYDENRLYLTSSENTYTVMSRNEPVKPSSLSIGEKNIISLCYFFSTLFKEENIKQLFQKECILILDDPLSSFDFENKVGVYSFLRYILNELHCGNEKSKSIILTHDLDVLYNMTKVYSDININKKKIGLFNLLNKNLEVINNTNYDEYSQLLQNIYNFVIDSSSNDLNIGNNLRRVLEAYATFNYKCGIEELTRDPAILEHFTEAQKNYFSNSMYRLILNTESHLNERSKLILSTTFKEHFSIDEKVKTAKDILMFLYLLNPLHLELHLKVGNEDINIKTEQIKSWIDTTFPSAPTEPLVSIIS
ncbi:AAA family ATPase [Solibacillus sp. FSL R5-0449]|uniref:AAA family ATPase n=1 Tax=Solibacillus sp. FSL R5-0449 TaxID=2921639 RepID=UPI0030D0E37B